MGAGIAQVAARAGYDVVMRDVAEEFLARGIAAIDKSLQRDVDKDRLRTDEQGAILARIKTTTDIAVHRGRSGDGRLENKERDLRIA